MRPIGLKLATALVAIAAFSSRQTLHGEITTLRVVTTPDTIRTWDRTIDTMLRSKELMTRTSEPDALVAGRTIERLDQYYKGVPIWNANVARQLQNGATVSAFGLLYADPSLDVEPSISADDARAIINREGNVADASIDRSPELFVVATDDGAFRLAWIGEAANSSLYLRVFVDAHSGRVIQRLNLFQTQAANAYVGHGVGVLGDDKKISSYPLSGGYVLFDSLRPPDISTFNLRSNVTRTLQYLSGLINLAQSDYGFSTNNDWTDAAAVDAHAYASLTYDYYYKRFGRRGLDNADARLWNIVHVVSRNDIFSADADVLGTFYLNAFYTDTSRSVMVYGEGMPGGVYMRSTGQRYDYFSGAIDIVAHELTHGVTSHSSRLAYVGESGALNESFSDIMGTSVEFANQPAGTGLRNADYLLGEDIVRGAASGAPNGSRSLSNPSMFGDPDHYSRRAILPNDDEHDNGGVHTNSSISNQAFYLAIEGGANRTSGMRVTGIGGANRIQIEKIFYRAFTQLLPSNATFSVARAATLQAAIDLYGLNSSPYLAVRDAWTAVGVN